MMIKPYYQDKESALYCGDNSKILKIFPDECIDLTITSPPYDDMDENFNPIPKRGLRKYQGYSWDFKTITRELFRITKKGGVVVWIVNDPTIKGSESLASCYQKIYFRKVGFNIHDTMIFEVINPVPQFKTRRYTGSFEYVFILSKRKPGICNYIMEDCKESGKLKYRKRRDDFNQSCDKPKQNTIVKDQKIRRNVWKYKTGRMLSSKDAISFNHPATFPEQLANDHIISWSSENNIILDPFSGSGTTWKMAKLNNRKFIGIEIAEEYCKLSVERVKNHSF